MVTYVRMPKLTWTMEEGIVGEWHKKEGEKVEKGDILCEIETEKSVDELIAPESGVVGKIAFPKGSVAKVNEIIAVIIAEDDTLPDKVPIGVEAKGLEAKSVDSLKTTETVPNETEELKVSPIAKRLAEEHGIDLTRIQGTGPEGRVVKEDVLKLIEKKPQTKTVPLSRIREVIKNRLSVSARNALQVPLTIDVDMTEAIRLIEQSRPEMEQRYDVHATVTTLVIKSVAATLEAHPILNARFVNEQIEFPEEINVGVAVSIEDGLVVPVIRNANNKTVVQIAKELAALVKKARSEALSTTQSTGGTFTVSNLGMFGIDFFAPIINPPESAILGVGRIAKKPVVVNEEVALRLMMTLTLVFDHRIMDAVVAAKFLQSLKEKLEKPIELFHL